MVVLVVGGAGYIGSHTAHALRRRGHDVIIYDNLSTGHRGAVPTGRLIEGELLDRERVTAALTEKKIDAVMHFAAFALVGESVADPAKYYQNNVVASLSLLEAMRAVQREGPYQLGGWCFGGVVAFETARRLMAAGQQVDPLVLIDTLLPAAMAKVRDHARLPQEPGEVIALELITAQWATVAAAGSYAPAPLSGSLTLIRAADSDGATQDKACGARTGTAVRISFVQAHLRPTHR